MFDALALRSASAQQTPDRLYRW